jgi:hypothetical protein
MSTHGHTAGGRQSGSYKSWAEIKRRCLDPNRNIWEFYGGDGVKVCSRWMDFIPFYEDMGDRPHETSIDRKNIDESTKHYSCGKCDECIRNGWVFHCRWATVEQQSMNRRMFKNNTSGYRGVSYHKANKKWVAKLKNKYLGTFKTVEEAKESYDSALRELKGY